MRLTPLHDRVVVRHMRRSRTTAAGIVIPRYCGRKASPGEVIAVGPGRRLEDACPPERVTQPQTVTRGSAARDGMRPRHEKTIV